jgi:hypothetical protein
MGTLREIFDGLSKKDRDLIESCVVIREKARKEELKRESVYEKATQEPRMYEKAPQEPCEPLYPDLGFDGLFHW